MPIRCFVSWVLRALLMGTSGEVLKPAVLDPEGCAEVALAGRGHPTPLPVPLSPRSHISVAGFEERMWLRTRQVSGPPEH